MKQLFGEPYNLEETIIGIIVKENRSFLRRKDYVLVTDQIDIKGKYKAIITGHKLLSEQQGVSGVSNTEELNNGDIVTIDSSGVINVVYEKGSKHNAIFITGRCNSNCIMCSQPPVKKEADRFKLNIEYIRLLPKQTESIGLTGGEPTVIGEQLFGIIKEIKKRQPKIHINILSNGIKFKDKKYAYDYASCINERTVIEIPLYCDIDHIHNNIVGTKTFYDTIKGIYNLASYNVKIGIRVVVMKHNYKRLANIAEFIYSNMPFVYQIAFMQMEPTGHAINNINELWIDPYDYNEQLEKAVLILHYRDMHVSIYNSQLCILPEKIRRFAVKSISEWKNIYVQKCDLCNIKSECPGFFASSEKFHSRKIQPVMNTSS